MPGTFVGRYELEQAPVATYEKMGRHFQCAQLVKEGVRITIQSIEKQISDTMATELTGWQTDIVNDQQIDSLIVGTIVLVGRSQTCRLQAPAFFVDIHGQ